MMRDQRRKFNCREKAKKKKSKNLSIQAISSSIPFSEHVLCSEHEMLSEESVVPIVHLSSCKCH